MKTQYNIVPHGFYFRAVSDHFQSPLFTSASQAGLYIGRLAGKEARKEAEARFGFAFSVQRLARFAGQL